MAMYRADAYEREILFFIIFTGPLYFFFASHGGFRGTTPDVITTHHHFHFLP